MLDLITNPVLISVVVVMILCFLKVNVMLSLLIASIVGGVAGQVSGVGVGGDVLESMRLIISGMTGKNNVALSYILLGAMAVAIGQTGIVKILCLKLIKVFGDKRVVTVLIIAGVASLSQNLIPVHIAFIPILIPPLLYAFNKMGLDRRAVALALVFGLKAPYMIVPMGFGLMFGGIVASNMNLAYEALGLPYYVVDGNVWFYLLIPVLLGMGGGLLFGTLFTYRKRREYEQRDLSMEEIKPEDLKFTRKHALALVGIVLCFGLQVVIRGIGSWGWFGIDSGVIPPGTAGLGLHLGAILCLVFYIVTGVINFKEMDSTVAGGLKLMAGIAFIMLSAGGFAAVMRANDNIHVERLVESIVGFTGTSPFVLVLGMFLVSVVITYGIGTSFGTVPIIAPIFVPLAVAGGLSIGATICLIGASAAIGDAGSPASDSTLGTSAGLVVDGQHDHIYDTCLPCILHFDIPLIVFGTVAAVWIL